MFQNVSKTTKLFAGLIGAVVLIMIIAISISGNETSMAQQGHYVNDNASADNKVEALKTMTADLLSVEDKNKQLSQMVKALQDQNKKAIVDLKVDLKKSVSDQMQKALQSIEVQDTRNQRVLSEKYAAQNSPKLQDYPINGESDDFVWVSDLSRLKEQPHAGNKNKDASENINKNEKDFQIGEIAQSFLNNDTNHSVSSNNHKLKQSAIKPIYTIPVNATLTGATLMTPLVGRVPIDGRLPSPYHFKLVLSGSNLTANGYPMPGVKGAVMSGIASGDMLGSCARGDINSITFIFNDGTISTTSAQSDQGNDNGLGYLSSQTGNPCIAGTFHSNAAVFLGTQMGLAAAEGYANALSSSQYNNSTTSEGASISTLIGSANRAAMGQGASAASQAAQTWWNKRVQNSFDYVYVPNVNSKTGKPMKVVVNITQQIPINYDTNARKVSYADSIQANQNDLD